MQFNRALVVKIVGSAIALLGSNIMFRHPDTQNMLLAIGLLAVGGVVFFWGSRL